MEEFERAERGGTLMAPRIVIRRVLVGQEILLPSLS
jgi:hypothetical protein